MKLVIVESPTKAKTLSGFLGDKFVIEASMGHVRDLPPSKLGVDVEHDFVPDYVLVKGKSAVVKKLKVEAKKADEIILKFVDNEKPLIAEVKITGGVINAEKGFKMAIAPRVE